MSIIKFLIILVLSAILLSCNKDHNTSVPALTVEKYIELLKSNQYDSVTLPAFSYQDIPALLKYRNETQIITNFPLNPISSFLLPECKLGIYVLWTIESIRAVSIDSKNLILRFPSLNPILANQASGELGLIYSEESHQIVAKAYFDWWENNKHKNFNEFNFIDPLISTDYRWH
jgi:hypothetical protein